MRRPLVFRGQRRNLPGMITLFKRREGGASPVRAKAGADVSRRLEADPAVERAEVEGLQFYRRPDFLTADQCQRLMAMIDRERRPSTLLSDSPDANFRTSDSCDMERWSPDVQPIDEAIANLLGLPFEQGETMQGQRYAPGQQFRAHHDWFHTTQGYWKDVAKHGGQRTWTAMIYLNDVAEGGATWFPKAGIRARPERGLLLAWNNMLPDGTPNVLTLHEGMPVVRGTKYIVTKWFREGSWL